MHCGGIWARGWSVGEDPHFTKSYLRRFGEVHTKSLASQKAQQKLSALQLIPFYPVLRTKSRTFRRKIGFMVVQMKSEYIAKTNRRITNLSTQNKELAPLQISNRSHQTARNKFWNWENLKSKLKNGQNWKSWDRKFVNSPNLGREKLSHPRLWHTVRLTSKLLMQPTSVLASDPQAWLFTLNWCKKCIFWYFVIYCQNS